MKALESFAKNIESNLEISGVVGIDFTVILTILPMLLQLFQSCKAPVPPNPNPSPTPSEQKAWELKCTATSAYDETQADYSRPVLHRMASTRFHQNKRALQTPPSWMRSTDWAGIRFPWSGRSDASRWTPARQASGCWTKSWPGA